MPSPEHTTNEPRAHREPVHIAIVGSRDYPRLHLVTQLVASLPPGSTVISGGARGVDRAAARAARARGLEVVEILPDYRTHAGRAPFIRNESIASLCQKLVAFWDLSSHGTAHVVGCAHRRKKPTAVFGPHGGHVPTRQVLDTHRERGRIWRWRKWKTDRYGNYRQPPAPREPK